MLGIAKLLQNLHCLQKAVLFCGAAATSEVSAALIPESPVVIKNLIWVSEVWTDLPIRTLRCAKLLAVLKTTATALSPSKR